MNKLTIAIHKVDHQIKYRSLHFGIVSGVYECKCCSYQHHNTPDADSYCIRYLYLEPPVLPDDEIVSMSHIEKAIKDHTRVTINYLKRHGSKFNIPKEYVVGWTSQHNQSYQTMIDTGLIEEYYYQDPNERFVFGRCIRLKGAKHIINPRVATLDLRTPRFDRRHGLTDEEFAYFSFSNYGYDTKTQLWNKRFDSETFTTEQLKERYNQLFSA